MAVSTCRACGEVFSSEYSFDQHWTGHYGKPIYQGSQIIGYTASTRRCLSADEMRARGMIRNKYRRWITASNDSYALERSGTG